MRSVLSVISDENLMNRIKLMLNDETVKYYFASNADDASDMAVENEIAVAIVDFKNPVISGQELCELLLAINPEIQIFMFFDEKEAKDVLDIYNKYHIYMLMCKQFLVLEDLPSLIESCLHKYNREEEIDKLDDDVRKLNDLYLKPMNDMSSLLNERLSGYANVLKVFRNSIHFVLDSSEETLKSIDIFADRIINDFIQIFMIKEPDVSVYFDRIHESFNKPDERKYFKFICENINILDEQKYKLLFVLDVITIYFDVFYQYYRGKVSVTNEGEDIIVNSIYEVRRDSKVLEVYDYVFMVFKNILSEYTSDMKYGVRDNIIQFKTIVSK